MVQQFFQDKPLLPMNGCNSIFWFVTDSSQPYGNQPNYFSTNYTIKRRLRTFACICIVFHSNTVKELLKIILQFLSDEFIVKIEICVHVQLLQKNLLLSTLPDRLRDGVATIWKEIVTYIMLIAPYPTITIWWGCITSFKALSTSQSCQYAVTTNRIFVRPLGQVSYAIPI